MRPKYKASEMMDEMQRNNDYKLVDLIKSLCISCNWDTYDPTSSC